MRIFLSLLLILATPLDVFADRFIYPLKTVETLIICGHGVDCSRALRVFATTQEFYATRLNLLLKPVLTARISQDMSGSPEERMAKWLTETKDLRTRLNPGLTLVFLEAYPSSVDTIDFERESILGMASDIGVLGQNSALAWIKVIGSNRVASRIAIHEVGHLAGAWHTSGLGIMAQFANSNILASEFDPISIKQIQQVVEALP